jgi:hypothetical protein
MVFAFLELNNKVRKRKSLTCVAFRLFMLSSPLLRYAKCSKYSLIFAFHYSRPFHGIEWKKHTDVGPCLTGAAAAAHPVAGRGHLGTAAATRLAPGPPMDYVSPNAS